jgi:hypothetical protein
MRMSFRWNTISLKPASSTQYALTDVPLIRHNNTVGGYKDMTEGSARLNMNGEGDALPAASPDSRSNVSPPARSG